MTNEYENFGKLVDLALQNAALVTMRPVVEKELLHYDILFCLDKEGLLNELTFQGGTSLRLCYGGTRYSEDLVFAGGVGFTSSKLAAMKSCIETYIGGRYGLSVVVKEPDELKKDPLYAEVLVNKWQISVITAPKQKDMPHQKIKLEVADIPAYTSEPRALTLNYSVLPTSYADVLVNTETLNEILADKMVSLSATQRYIRNRDLWDIPWLIQQGATLDAELVTKKIGDYRLTDFKERLATRIQTLPEIINGEQLANEMRRFIPADAFERTLAQDKFKKYLINTLTEIHGSLQKQLYDGGVDIEDDFKM